MLSWTVYVVPFLQGIPIRALKLPSPSVKKPAFLAVRPWIFRFSELLLLCPGQSRSFGAARQWGPRSCPFCHPRQGKPAHAGNEPENGINAAHILCHILDTLPDGRVNEELVANFPMLGTGNESTNVVCADAWAKGEARSRNLEELSRYAEFVKIHAEDCAKKAGALVSVEKELLYEPFLIEETAPILQKAKKP